MPPAKRSAGAARSRPLRALRGDERDEDVVDDLAQDVVGDGLESHHHFVAEQVKGEIDDPGGEPGRVDLPALDGTVDDLFDSRAALTQESLAELGRGGAGLMRSRYLLVSYVDPGGPRGSGFTRRR